MTVLSISKKRQQNSLGKSFRVNSKKVSSLSAYSKPMLGKAKLYFGEQ
jgi:hypothetical protein